MFVFSTAIGEGLVSINQDLQAVPLLAESWSISDDFLTWTFKLRQGVQFHKGYGEMTAEDVVYSYQQWAQNAPHSDNAEINRVWNNPAGSVETPDSHTVVVNTGDPVADVILYQFLASAGGSPTWTVSKRQSEESGVEAANLDIATTGPWEIDDHRTGEFWRMKAVEDQWRKTPHFAEVVFWQIPEEAARLAGFQTGNLDTMNMTFDSIPLVESVPGSKLMTVTGAANLGLRIHGQYYLNLGTPDQRPGYSADLPWVSSTPDVNSAEWDKARKVRLALVTAIEAWDEGVQYRDLRSMNGFEYIRPRQ
jgi:peptide/nickel transport system substrate-binding protein